MQIVKSPKTIQHLADNLRRKGKTIGFVPTMGALHKGHISLIERSAKENDITVVSIFVNPTQFGPNEDFAKYPRAFKADCQLALKAGADIIFHPSVDDMYPKGFQAVIVPGAIAEKLEGAARPGHMRGVATICTKLFNIVKPHRAYFGQKDAQQLAMIKRLVVDLQLDLKIVDCPIVRTNDGIAMSSRHSYLSEDELKKAAVIYGSLKFARRLIKSGKHDMDMIRRQMIELIEAELGLVVEYISFNRWDSLEDIAVISGKVLVSIVVRVGAIRLLDNIIISA